MRKVSLIKLVTIIGFALAFSGCIFDDDDESTSGINVEGRWTATVRVDNCAPLDVCRPVGFESGETFTAVMTLSQDGDRVEGTYTYQGAGISADVEGRITDTQLTLSGDVQNPFGTATVGFVGHVSGNLIDAAISHDVRLFDGRQGTVSGSGDFTR